MNSPRAIAGPIPNRTLILFVLPTLMIGFMHGPEGAVQGIYAKYGGLALTALAAAFLLTRVFDAVTYPLIGYWSDRSFARTGSRRAWILGGAAISVVGMWFLYRPPPGVSIYYYGVWSAVTYLGWKMSEIPYLAWSYGLSRDYAQRARIQTWRMMASLFGNILFFSMPFLAKGLGMSETTDVNLGTLGITAMVCAAFLPVTFLLAVAYVPGGEAGLPSATEQRGLTVMQTLGAMRRNGALLRLLAAFAPMSFCSGMASGVSFLFIDAYLKQGEIFAAVSVLALLLTFLGIPLWGSLAMRFERHKVWAVSLVTCALAYSGLALTPPAWAGPALFVLYPLATLCIVGVIVALTMVGDIVDYGRLQTGEDLAGTYAAAIAFLQKSVQSVSAAAGLALVGWFGFDPAAALQSESGALGIRLVAVVIPALGMGCAAAIIWSFPLTREKMAEIRMQLAARAEAENPTPKVSTE